MKGLKLENIEKTVGGKMHLTGINLDFAPDSLNILLGRTLAGKTSLLRLMAGLDKPSKGRIFINGKDVTGVSVRKRSVAMVYQQFINYPSMTVYKNIASALITKGMKKAERDHRVRETAEMLNIEKLLDRLPSELSGGQQQRVAIARALVKEAHLLLLDEPLVNLDYKLREGLRAELRDIFERRESIVVYTTTEPTEALMLGGNIVVIDEGRVIQSGLTPEVYHNPATMKVAEVFSDPLFNYMDADVNGKYLYFGKDIRVPLDGHLKGLTPGDCQVGVRSNHLFLKRKGANDVELKVRVELSEINGSQTITHVHHKDSSLVVLDEGIYPQKIGSEIPVFVNPQVLFIFDSAGNLVASPGKDRSKWDVLKLVPDKKTANM
jgi:glycerol transport system ATP-binding protein